MTFTPRPGVPGATEPVSTTRRTLRRRLRFLLVATGLVLSTSLVVVSGTYRTAEAVGTRGVPAVQELTAVRTALIRANNAAVVSFRSQQARLGGPGEEYQSQIVAAGQSLAEAAEDIGSGDEGSRQLQLLEGLLASYVGLIGQADAHYRKSGSGGLATTYLWYANRLLYSQILNYLDKLRNTETEAVQARLSSRWLGWHTQLVLAALVLVLLVPLIRTQLFLRRRFRRRFNRALAAATLILLGYAVVGTSLGLAATQQLAVTRDELTDVVGRSNEQSVGIETKGRQAMTELLRASCPEGSCGVTVDDFRNSLIDRPQPSSTAEEAAAKLVLEASREVNERAARASSASSGALLALLAVSPVVLLVWLGLEPRIKEYRYQSR